MITEIETLKRNAYLYFIDEHFVIIAGRTSRDNDFISLKVAGQNDLWFHVKGVPGSHVLLRPTGDEQPLKKHIEIAAAVAAYYSKARNGGVVPVSYTLAKNVSKPRGVSSGTVCIKKEQTIKVRPALPVQ
ncbi:MAG: hypothetical protein PWR01_3579 [Clostridiales bacterium]|jgi:predicted ribosome quality control (RQC) complex YloA/Tae2 family protein|nr:hypothetical protein [Clostridiales bacterium]MDN5282506.1 hypothetical protein [Candidatus Ozemobacter sp.]